MKELLTTPDPVALSFAEAVLKDAGIESVVLDRNASTMLIAAASILPRLMVDDDDLARARRVLRDSGVTPS